MLEQLLDAATDAALVALDTEFRLIYLNATANKIFDFNDAQLIGRSLRDLHICKEVAAARFDAAVKQIKAGQTYEFRLEQPDKDSVRFLGMRVSGLWQEDLLTGYLLLARDISERVILEQSLQEKESHLRVLLETLPYGIEELDTDGRVVFGNSAYHRMLGYEPGELIGLTMWDRIPVCDSSTGEGFADRPHLPGYYRAAADPAGTGTCPFCPRQGRGCRLLAHPGRPGGVCE